LPNARLYSFRVAGEKSMKPPVPRAITRLIDNEILKLILFHSSKGRRFRNGDARTVFIVVNTPAAKIFNNPARHTSD
jgi:hypothetical protein